MKVVLFCGGLGTRLREHSETTPKPLVNVGSQPIMWHLMRSYAHFGHTEFILCLGFRGDMIREYFLNYNEAMANDFTLSDGGRKIEIYNRDFESWRITFVDTGLHSNIGQRLLRVRKYVDDDEVFMANYADGLSDVPMDQQIADFTRRDVVATFLSVQSSQSFHVVEVRDDGMVDRMGPIRNNSLYINGGYFILKNQIFDYINEGEELVDQPFQRLIKLDKLATFRWHGFWQCMDSFKDKITLDRLEARGECPWMVWKQHPAHLSQ